MDILYHKNYTSTNNGIVVCGVHFPAIVRSKLGARQLAARLAATQPPRADRRTAQASTNQEPLEIHNLLSLSPSGGNSSSVLGPLICTQTISVFWQLQI